MRVPRKSVFEAVVSIGGRMLSVILVIGSTKFLTNFLSEADYGKLALYNITAILPSTFFFGPLGQGILRYYYVAHEKAEMRQFDNEFTTLYHAGAFLTIIIGAVTAFFCLSAGNVDWVLATLLITSLNVMNAINSYRYGLQNAARQRIAALSLETGDRLLQQILAILFLWLITDNPLIVLVGYNVSALLFLYLNRIYYRKAFPETQNLPFNPLPFFLSVRHFVNNHPYSRNLVIFSWPFFLFGIFAWIQNASDRWALELFRSTEMVGQYALLNQIGFQSLSLLFGAVSYFIFPILFNRAGSLQQEGQFENANRLNNNYLWFNAILTTALCLTFWLFGESVIRLLSAEKYESLAGLLPLMAVAGGLFNFGQIYTNRFMLSMQTRLLLFPKIISAVFGSTLSIIAVAYSNLYGLVVAAVISQILYVLILFITWNWVGNKNAIQSK